MAYKKERLEKIIGRELGQILLNDTKDKRLKYVTITKVALTEDLSIATIYYRVLGNDDQIKKTSESLEKAKGFLRTAISKQIKVRKIPELIFKFDHSFEQGNRIEEILESLDK